MVRIILLFAANLLYIINLVKYSTIMLILFPETYKTTFVVCCQISAQFVTKFNNKSYCFFRYNNSRITLKRRHHHI